MTDWSAMAWEPCILKHGSRYDDPWTINEYWEKKKNGDKINPRQKVCILWDTTGTLHRFDKICDAVEFVTPGKTSKDQRRHLRLACARNGMRFEIVEEL